ncbi:1165_t:CDS:2 [Gigaspora rosea]|nr:1165_t:CDS:2 [Gigaspora rosea]
MAKSHFFLDNVISKFISIHSTISPGTSATAYIEQDYSMPCITCWSAERLDEKIITKLSKLFKDRFDIVNKVVSTDIDDTIDKKNPKKNYQNFCIAVNIWAKVITIANKSYSNILEFNVDLYNCETGPMLSKNWKLLHDLGFGYFLDSVEIKISPIPHKNDDNIYQMIVPKVDYKQPLQLNQPIEIISDRQTSKGVEERDGCSTTGVCWLYRPVSNVYKRDVVPGNHSGQWYTLKTMCGFSITITQILRCEFSGHGLARNQS